MPINKNKPKKKKAKKVVPNSAQLASHQRAIIEQSGRSVIPKSAKKKSSSPKAAKPAKKMPAKSKVSYMNPDGLGKNSPMPKKQKSYMSYKNGGKVKKAKGAKNIDKVKRKVAQVKNRKVEKAFTRTHNTNLQDKPRSGNTGVYSKGGFIQYD